MKQRNWGRVVFISSESAIQIPAEMIHYGMTKTAQLALSRGVAETCAGTGVTVNVVLPELNDLREVERSRRSPAMSFVILRRNAFHLQPRSRSL
jgi:NAD(P)-dependent dehydrogenase (short-subunit alcohol dehydrogenase family)